MSDFLKDQISKTIRHGVARAQSLVDAGNVDEALTLCNYILARDFTAAGANIIVMRIAMANGHWDEALAHGESALRTRPAYETGEFATGLDVGYHEVADDHEHICRTIMAEQTDSPILQATMHYHLGVADHARGRLDDARSHYESVLALRADAYYVTGQVLNLLAALEHQSGNPAESLRWLDLDTFPLELEPMGTVGGTVAEAFNEALFDEVMNSPKLAFWQESQSEQWYIAPELNDAAAGPCVTKLETEFRRLADANIEKFCGPSPAAGHPSFANRPAPYDLQMFSAVLKGPGHVGPHVHSEAFLVGNYYVRVPEEPDDAPEGAGCIEYGKHLYSSATGMDYRRRRFDPKAGTMLMWPAYFSHATIPSTAPGTRMVVGFDVVAKGAKGTYTSKA